MMAVALYAYATSAILAATAAWATPYGLTMISRSCCLVTLPAAYAAFTSGKASLFSTKSTTAPGNSPARPPPPFWMPQSPITSTVNDSSSLLACRRSPLGVVTPTLTLAFQKMGEG